MDREAIGKGIGNAMQPAAGRVRPPAVAGAFYPDDPAILNRALTEYFMAAQKKVQEIPSCGIVVPHAGYMYSGHVAAYSYLASKNEIKKAGTVVVIGPNHTGSGPRGISVSSSTWSTPLGLARADTEFAKALADEKISVDESAHEEEHSIEVQIPFLQYIKPDVMIVPVCMRNQDKESAVHLATKIYETARKLKRNIFIVASSDFSHYVPADIGERADKYIIESILKLDVDGFYERIYETGASLCGYGPIAALMTYSKLNNCEGGQLLKFGSSGDINASYSQVVDYAAITFPRPASKKANEKKKRPKK